MSLLSFQSLGSGTAPMSSPVASRLAQRWSVISSDIGLFKNQHSLLFTILSGYVNARLLYITRLTASGEDGLASDTDSGHDDDQPVQDGGDEEARPETCEFNMAELECRGQSLLASLGVTEERVHGKMAAIAADLDSAARGDNNNTGAAGLQAALHRLQAAIAHQAKATRHAASFITGRKMYTREEAIAVLAVILHKPLLPDSPLISDVDTLLLHFLPPHHQQAQPIGEI